MATSSEFTFLVTNTSTLPAGDEEEEEEEGEEKEDGEANQTAVLTSVDSNTVSCGTGINDY